MDGYNFIFRFLQDEDDLAKKRQQLIKDLNEKAQKLHLNITIVFDSQYREGESTRSHFQSVAVHFTSQGETADEYILKAIQGEIKGQATVVTSDKKLALFSKLTHAKTETIEQFVNWINRRQKNVTTPKKHKEKEPPKVVPKKKKPTKADSVEQCHDYYLEQFGHENLPVKKDKEEKKYPSDFDRWLDIFSRHK